MPVYDVEVRGRTFEVDAPDDRTALTHALKFSTLPADPNARPSEGQRARVRSEESRMGYLGDAVSNIPGDALQQVKGAVTGAGSLVQRLGHALGKLTTGDASEIAAMPGELARGMGEHYAGYLDPDERARRVRDEPVGTVLDLIPVGGVLKASGQTAARAGAAVAGKVPAIVAKVPAMAKDAAIGAAKGAAAGALMGEPISGGLIGGAVGALKRRAVGAVADTVDDALTPKATTAANKAASERMVTGMSGGKVDTAAIARGEIAAANAPGNVHLRTTTKPGILVGDMTNVQIVDRIKELKTARRATSDAAERASIDTELAVLEKAERQRQHVTFQTGVREARKVSTSDIARQVIQEVQK